VKAWIPVVIAALVALAVPAWSTAGWVRSAGERLAEAEVAAAAAPAPVAVAAAANEAYCTPELKTILRRVLQSCGLLGAAERGCQPATAAQVASLSGGDFNALFLPMKERAGVVQYAASSAELDDAARALIDRVYTDQRGASYFFVVARASPDGRPEDNAALSQARAEAVLEYLKTRFADPDLERSVGLLWLGEEFAQLESDFCDWSRSGASDRCDPKDLNRSAFLTWVDCTL